MIGIILLMFSIVGAGFLITYSLVCYLNDKDYYGLYSKEKKDSTIARIFNLIGVSGVLPSIILAINLL